MKRLIVFLLGTFMWISAANAQSAEKLTKMISTDKVTFAQAAYFSASASGLIADNASDEQAFSLLQERGIIAKKYSAGDKINLSQTAWILSNTWNVSGSLMYKIFPSPRYAFKQMKADGIIDGHMDPSKIPDGREYLNILTRCLSSYTLIIQEQ